MKQKKLSTKEKILDLLKKEVSLSVNELTEYLQITHMAVRKHLTSLENADLIKSQEIKQQMGRPLQKYSLSQKGERLFPKNYEGITIEFLKDVKEISGEESVDLLFNKRKQRLRKEYSERIIQEVPAEKIKELLNIQNEKGYMAETLQVDDNTYELIEYNCPISAIANEFKIACSCETELLKSVLKTEKINRTNCQTDGDSHCKFLIKF